MTMPGSKASLPVWAERSQALVLFLFLFPLFFQLSGEIFTSSQMDYDSQGNIALLPLPIAAFVCLIGIVLFLRLEKNNFGVGFIFSLFMLLVLGSIVATGGEQEIVVLAKFIHLMQFVIPPMAFVLGHLYLQPRSEYLGFESLALLVLLIVIPLQVYATLENNHVLAPNLFLFSLYQHFQYLPVIFIGLYLLTAATYLRYSLQRILVMLLTPIMGIYLAQTLSVAAALLAVSGFALLLWSGFQLRQGKFALILALLFFTPCLAYLPVVQNTAAYMAKFEGYAEPVEDSTAPIDRDIAQNRALRDAPVKASPAPSRTDLLDIPGLVTSRLQYWRFHLDGILENPRVFLFGHAKRPDRDRFPSAHNYYLDLTYNFGVVSLLPFLFIIFSSLRKCFAVVFGPGGVNPGLLMHMFLVAFFVFIDNSLKVGFRQPYPGMIMFFLWGVLFVRVNSARARNAIDGRRGA